jgi:6-phosphogluconolactonase
MKYRNMKTFGILSKTALVALSTMLIFSCRDTGEPSVILRFYVGSSNGIISHSIYLCELDAAKGEFVKLDSFSGAKAGAYLDLSPEQKFLFAVNQEPWIQEPENASVTSFSIETGTLALNPINSQSSEGSDICYISCSKKGDYIFVANYGSGQATALPVGENGEIGPAASVVTGEGSGPDESRQQGPHAHQAILDPGQHFLLVPDLGTDRVMIYAFDPGSGKLTPNPAQPYFQLAPGAGPRHLAFHPDGKSLYIVNELNSTMTACTYDGMNGILAEVNTINTVEESHQGMKYPAAVRVHPNGHFVYASTRGENSCLTAFKIEDNRSVARIQVMDQVPLWPREFNLDSTGRYLLVAGERSDEIRLYTIDPESGLMSATESMVKLPAPACIRFIK